MNKLMILANEGIFVAPEREKTVPSLKVADSVIAEFEKLGVKVTDEVRVAFSVSYKSYLDDVLEAFKTSGEYATTLKLGDDSVLLSKVKRILLSETILSEFDMKTLKYCLKETPELVKNAVPDYIPRKEIMAIVASYGIKVPVVSPTDVLRMMSYFSRKGTNLSLGLEKFKGFGSIPLDKKDYLLSLLEGVVNINTMWKYRTYWLSFFDKINIESYKEVVPKSYAAYTKLKNFEMYNSFKQIERAFSKNINRGIKEFAKFPRLFLRNIIMLLTDYPYMYNTIMSEFTHSFYKFKMKDIMMLVNYLNKKSVLSEDTIYQRKNNLIYIDKYGVISSELHKLLKTAVLKVIQKNSHSYMHIDTWIDPELKYVEFPSNISDEAIKNPTLLSGYSTPINSKEDTITIWVSANTKYMHKPYCVFYNVDTGNVKRVNMMFNSKKDDSIVFTLHIDLKSLANKYTSMIVFAEGKESMAKMGVKFGISHNVSNINIDSNYVNITAHGKVVALESINFEDGTITHINAAAPNDILSKKYIDSIALYPMISVYDVVKARVNPSLAPDAPRDKFKKAIMLENTSMMEWLNKMIQ